MVQLPDSLVTSRSLFMCCFSKKVDLVADTNIFARASKEGRQFLVYSMRFKAGEELAMILPIPVPKESKEDAVKFLNLEKYDNFFTDMRAGFPVPATLGPPSRGDVKKDLPNKKLEVVEVGSFVASFVPSIKDFARLDERFRLPTDVWNKLPQYKNWGFAVFQLKKGEMKVHPMAFEFPRANPRQLFFPTVHIHDGQVHDKADFHHALYLQPANSEVLLPDGWEESTQPAGMFMNMKKSAGLFNPELHCYRMGIHGMQKNQDTLV
jgi:hypothetical protein